MHVDSKNIDKCKGFLYAVAGWVGEEWGDGMQGAVSCSDED